jgi:hypothetical protein
LITQYDFADFDKLNYTFWKAIKGDRPTPAPARGALP